MSNEGERPVPTPRPRQLKSTSDETDSAYENFTLKPLPAKESFYDELNAQLNDMKVEMQRPMPMPRSSKAISRNYENSPINNSEPPPSPKQQPDLPPKTGAIRKTPNIPTQLENKLNNNVESTENNNNKDDVLSLSSSSTSGKSNSEKFVTPSPT